MSLFLYVGFQEHNAHITSFGGGFNSTFEITIAQMEFGTSVTLLGTLST